MVVITTLQKLFEKKNGDLASLAKNSPTLFTGTVFNRKDMKRFQNFQPVVLDYRIVERSLSEGFFSRLDDSRWWILCGKDWITYPRWWFSPLPGEMIYIVMFSSLSRKLDIISASTWTKTGIFWPSKYRTYIHLLTNERLNIYPH